MTVDLRLYALLDPLVSGGHRLDDLARMIAPSVTIVQLRDKQGGTRKMVETARAVRAALPKSIPLVINDRVDVALAASVDGVHIGWDDLDASDARRLLGRDAIIGLSLQSVEQANAAPLELLDYVAIGGVFATSSKDNPKPPVGIAGLQAILAAVRGRAPRMPVVAIAGIDAANAASVVSAGADGIAVISALAKAKQPADAARNLRRIVDSARGAR